MRRAAGVKKARMSPAEVVRAREVLGLTQEGLAAHLAVTEREVHGWEGGSIRVSARHGRQLAWDAALREREDALAASGLPECEWMAREDGRTDVPDDLERHYAEIEAHAQTCTICRAREEFEVSRFGDMPEMPMDFGSRLMFGSMDLVERLPGWARPAAYGAAIVGAMVLLRVAVALLVQGPSLQLLEMAAVGLAMGAYLGLVGGISYTLVREPLRGLGRAGTI